MQQGNAVAAGPGFWSSVPRPTSKERRRSDLPGSWRTPLYARPALRPRQDGIRLAILTSHPARPSCSNKLPAPTGFSISGLHHTAYALAVYASQCGSPLHHARLATGWWLTSARWDSIPTGFQREVSLSYIRSPSPKLGLAHIQIQFDGIPIQQETRAFHNIPSGTHVRNRTTVEPLRLVRAVRGAAVRAKHR